MSREESTDQNLRDMLDLVVTDDAVEVHDEDGILSVLHDWDPTDDIRGAFFSPDGDEVYVITDKDAWTYQTEDWTVWEVNRLDE